MSERPRHGYDSGWGWVMPAGINWKLGRKPSQRRAALALFLDPLDFVMYRRAEPVSRVEAARSASPRRG